MKIRLENISFAYGEKRILEDVSYDFQEGAITSIMGANGCGKTTLLRITGRLLRPDSGRVTLDGTDIRKYSPRAVAGKLAMLSQLHDGIPSGITVEELVGFGRYPHRGLFSFGGGMRDRSAIDSAIEAMALEELRRRPVSKISGGELQRAWIAMTLAQEPEILILDEPATFLDAGSQSMTASLIRRLKRERGMTVILSLHDINMASRCSDEMLMLKDGGIKYSGVPVELMTKDIVRDVFGYSAETGTTASGRPYCFSED